MVHLRYFYLVALILDHLASAWNAISQAWPLACF